MSQGSPRHLRAEAHALLWGDYQRAHLRGDHDEADQLARRALALDRHADLLDAKQWQPKVRPRRLSPTERDALAHTFDRVHAEALLARIGAHARPHRNGHGKRSPRYAVVALEHETDTVRNAPDGDRNNTVSRAAWHVARFVCDGELDAGQVLEALIGAAVQAGLPRAEARATVRAALRRRTGRVA